MVSHAEIRIPTLLLVVDDVFQEVDRDLLVRGQIYAKFDNEEVVNLALGIVLGGELLRRDSLQLRRLADLIVLLACHWLWNIFNWFIELRPPASL